MEELDNNGLPKDPELLAEQAEQDRAPAEPYTPRPIGLRILAWVLAALVLIGLGLYYYHIFIGK